MLGHPRRSTFSAVLRKKKGKKRGKTGRESCPLSCVRHRACWCSDSVQTLGVREFGYRTLSCPGVEETGGMEGPEPRGGTVDTGPYAAVPELPMYPPVQYGVSGSAPATPPDPATPEPPT